MATDPIHLLYIDDDPGLRVLVGRFCARIGWRISTASGWSDGLALAGAGGIDAIALDHYMPGRDGLDVLPELLAAVDAPPVIYVTGAEEPQIAVNALKAGAADYVVKDTGGNFLELMASAVRQALARRDLTREKDEAERRARDSHARLELLASQQALLLREMNHRIANSLQLITSLLAIQARKSGDATVRDALLQASERVEAVAKVHGRLYSSADVTAVPMDDYLGGLLGEMERATIDRGARRIVLDAAPARVPTDKAVSLGLLVSELVTNALKYAYPDGTAGPVRVRFGPLPDQTDAPDRGAGGWMLLVEDDGVGFSEDDKPRGTGLGTMIIGAMARNMDATVERMTGPAGTRVAIRVPA